MAIPAQDVDALVSQLSDGCRDAGLDAQILAPTRVRISSPGTDSRLAEVIRCMPDQRERLFWWWSWGEPICPAERISDAVRIIRHVVAPREDMRIARSQSPVEGSST